MAQLKKVWVSGNGEDEPFELRIDWDNDRHQAVKIKGKDPQKVMDALEEMVEILDLDAFAGKI